MNNGTADDVLVDESRCTFCFRKIYRILALSVLFLSIVLGGPPSSAAAEAVFPAGSHFGLVPPPGFSSAANFKGFLYPGIGGSIVIEEMPRASFKHFQSMDMAAGLARIGVTITMQKSEKFGKLNGISVVGRQILRNMPYTKCILFLEGTTATAMITLQIPEKYFATLGKQQCAALATVVERADAGKVPPLPFELTDMGGMRTVRENKLNGELTLTAGPKNVVENAEQPVLIIGSSQGAVPARDRRTVARDMLLNFTALGNGKIVSETPLQIDGAPGYEIVASGTFGNTSVPIAVVLWVRFSEARNIRMTGFVATNQKDTAFGAFRRVRDGLRAR